MYLLWCCSDVATIDTLSEIGTKKFCSDSNHQLRHRVLDNTNKRSLKKKNNNNNTVKLKKVDKNISKRNE